MQSKLTIKESLEILGQALAHDSLKLTQKEHLILIEAYQTIKEQFEDEKDKKSVEAPLEKL